MTAVARKVRVTGRVQGVFYRAWTQEQARSAGLVGWVRNCPDSSVEVHLEGEEVAVDRLIERMRDGPPNARVDDLQIYDARPEQLDRFDVRH